MPFALAPFLPRAPDAPWLRDLPRQVPDAGVREADGVGEALILLDGTPSAVRQLYATSQHHRLRAQLVWSALGRWLWRRARRWWFDGARQLQLPLADGDLALREQVLASGDERWWLRRCGDDTLYAARYDAVAIDGTPWLRVTLPCPDGVLVSMLAPRVGPDRLQWLQAERPGGMYLVPHDRPARRVPWLGEDIELAPVRGGVAARHRLTLGGRVLVSTHTLHERSR